MKQDLFAMVFGEAVLNDAVAIVLTKTLVSFTTSEVHRPYDSLPIISLATHPSYTSLHYFSPAQHPLPLMPTLGLGACDRRGRPYLPPNFFRICCHRPYLRRGLGPILQALEVT